MRTINNFFKKNGSRPARGYTLIETSIVLLILATVVISIGLAYKVYMRTEMDARQLRSGVELQAALSRFVYVKGRLPCPADASLARTEAEYGKEVCTTPLPAVGGGTVPASGGCNQTIGGLCNTNQATTNIRRGMVPFVTLEIPEEKAYDPYGMRLNYMVSMQQTKAEGAPGTFYQKGNGTIGIRDIETVGGTEKSLIDPPNKADFIVFSAGPNRVGAFPRNGDTTGTPARMTAVPNPCTQGNTGGAGEFANCNNLTEVIYSGNIGRSFVNYNPGGTLPWDTSAFLDDNITYFSMNDATYWRQSVTTPTNMVLREAGGKVGVLNGTATETLDLGLSSGTPEAAIRSSGYVITKNDQVCKGVDCFKPKDLAGDPVAGTGGLKCPAGQIMRGIKGDGTSARPDCVPASGTFCEPPLRLKGFLANGDPDCRLPTNTDCQPRTVYICDESPTNRIAKEVNLRLSNHPLRMAGAPSAAWNDSPLTGLNPQIDLPLATSGTIIRREINTVQQKSASRTCAELGPRPPVTNFDLITGVHANNTAIVTGTGLPQCYYGFSGGKRIEQWTCIDTVWTMDAGYPQGQCFVACQTSSYPDAQVECNSLSWTHSTAPTKVRLMNPAPGCPRNANNRSTGLCASDDRAGAETQSVWSGTFTRPGGSSCGGVPPPNPTNPGGQNIDSCLCSGGPLNTSLNVDCDPGYKVDTNVITVNGPNWVDDNTFKQILTFTCRPTPPGRGNWSERMPKKEDVCECDSAAAQYVPYTCQGATTANGTVRWRQNRLCLPNQCPNGNAPCWANPGTAEGSCTCTPQNNIPGTERQVACAQGEPGVALPRPGTFGVIRITPRSNRACDKPLAAVGIVAPNTAFYPGGFVLGDPVSQPPTVDDSGCLPINSRWTPVNPQLPPTAENGTQRGGSCIGPNERQACINAGPIICPNVPNIDQPRPCFEPVGGGLNRKWDVCTCN